MILSVVSAEWVSASGTVLGSLVALGGVIVACRQLSHLNTTLRMNVLGVVLQLEAEMNARKQRVDEAVGSVWRELSKAKPNMELVKALRGELEGYFENWLNSGDRLAYCILRNYLPERDWKVEYRNYFAGLVRDHPERFGPDTIYTNILDLNDKWKRE